MKAQTSLNIKEIQNFLAVGNYIWKKTAGSRYELVPITEIIENIKDNIVLEEGQIRNVIDKGILAGVLRYNSAADKVALDNEKLASRYFELQSGVNYPKPFPCPRCHKPMNYIILENPPGNHNPKDAIRAYSCENILCGFHEQDPITSQKE